MISVAKSGAGVGIGISDAQFSTLSSAKFVSTGESDLSKIYIQEAEVLSVDLSNEDPTQYGRIQFRFISESGKDAKSNNWAYPLSSNVRQYPVLHEPVSIFQINGRYFYFLSLNAVGFINNNSLANLTERKSTGKDSIKNYKQVESSGIPNKTDDGDSSSVPLGKNFKNENNFIPILRPTEGDLIIQGRFRNFIRMGSNQPKSLLPNLKLGILGIRQSSQFQSVTENLDLDNSIWITSDENLAFKKPDIKIDQRNDPPSSLEGDQIILSSGRIILNSKNNELMMYSNKGVHFAATKNFSVDTGQFILLNCQKSIEISTKGKCLITTQDVSVISSKNIYLGSDTADEPLVLGKKAVELIRELLDAILQITHPTPAGPSGTPINTADFSRIKQKLDTILSKKNYTL